MNAWRDLFHPKCWAQPLSFPSLKFIFCLILSPSLWIDPFPLPSTLLPALSITPPRTHSSRRRGRKIACISGNITKGRQENASCGCEQNSLVEVPVAPQLSKIRLMAYEAPQPAYPWLSWLADKLVKPTKPWFAGIRHNWKQYICLLKK